VEGIVIERAPPGAVWHEPTVSRRQREALNGHRGCVVWLTGLSGAGKSTIANELDRKLHRAGVHAYLLDGDNVRHGLSAPPRAIAEVHGDDFGARFGLGFSAMDREENVRRIGAVARLFADAGLIAITAFISPYRRDRDRVRRTLAPGEFVEVFVDAPLAVCEGRDPKGMYRLARAGKLPGFTGIDDPYEPPEAPEIVLDSGTQRPDRLADQVIAYLRRADLVP
jgi:adenylylsulfate kinase